MASAQAQNYFCDSPPLLSQLKIEPHFSNLTDKEKYYAHYLSRAAHLGTRVTLRQVSPESEALFDIAVGLYKAVDGDLKKLGSETGVDEKEVTLWLEYVVSVLANLGNYKSFGDVKFIPRCTPQTFEKLASYTPETKKAYESISDRIFSVDPPESTLLGFPTEGHVTTYYPDSPDISQAEIEAIQEFMEANKILAENTRLTKSNKDGKKVFTLLKASQTTEPQSGDEKVEYDLPDGSKFLIKYGDYSKEMKEIADNIEKAIEYAANETQANMLKEYVKSFRSGSLEAHKQSQVYWVKDVGPKVESNLGFIETYRDPAGVRGEWEGLVAAVNDEQTKKFNQLVSKAGSFIPLLPWSKEFEKDAFMKPDFTSLEVLTFAGSGIPAGINIPNYDDIRQTIGFKNVSLGNVLSAKPANEKITFIKEEEQELMRKLRGPAFEVQVGIHELLGHGTGKLLQEIEPGKFNFDVENPPISPVTREKVKTWYKVGQTWGSVFGGVAASYEECRAECVAMYLGGDKDVLKIFGYDDKSEIPPEDVEYVEYLSMCRAGLAALEYWDPKTKKWGQAHMQARYAILRVLMSTWPPVAQINSSDPEHLDLTISVNRSLIHTRGKQAVGNFLQALHVFKSTADVEAGTKFYNDATTVTAEMASYRPAVVKLKQPRMQFVQANTVLREKGVELREYEPTLEGMVKSFAERGL